MFSPGQPLQLLTDNKLYQGFYRSRILQVHEHSLVIAMPEQKKKTFFLPAGTMLTMYIDGSQHYQAEVLSRSFHPQPTLHITLPHPVAGSVKDQPEPGTARVIAITSGKGGVGKTTMAINLSVALSRMQYRVCLIDADLGTANVDFLLNLDALYDISHLASGEKTLEEIMVYGPENLRIIPGCSSLDNPANMLEQQFARLVNAFKRLDQETDLIILDTGTGLSANVTNFLAAADEILLVTTPDPHAVLDAYALIKTLCKVKQKPVLKLVINRVENDMEEKRVKYNLVNACRSFLGLSVEYLGRISESRQIMRSIREMTPVIIDFPKTEAAAEISNIASRLAGNRPGSKSKQQSGLRLFLNELQNLFATTQGQN